MKKLLLIFSILIALLLTGCKNKTNDIAIIKFYTYNHMAYLVLNEHFLGKDTERKDNFKTILFVFEHFYDYSECPKYFSSSAKDFLSSFRNLDWDMEIAYQKSKELEKEMPEVIDASNEKAISLASREVYSGKIVSSKDEENK